MLQDALSKSLFKQISALNLSPIPNDDYAFKDTIKRKLLDEGEDFKFQFNNDKSFEVEMKCEIYKKALFSDYYFGRIRIHEQVKSLLSLIDGGNQIAWVLVTTYYSVFFMSNEISKMFGIYMTNFSIDDMKNLFSRASGNIPDNFIKRENSSFGYQVKIKQSDYEGYIKLSFYPKSPRAHVEVWKNLTDIINQLDVDDTVQQHKTLFLDIIDADRKKWSLPSKIRNDWNYTYANYYGGKGSDLGSVFFRNIRNSSAAYAWANKRDIQPFEKNQVASISYLYHNLLQVISQLDSKLGLE